MCPISGPSEEGHDASNVVRKAIISFFLLVCMCVFVFMCVYASVCVMQFFLLQSRLVVGLYSKNTGVMTFKRLFKAQQDEELLRRRQEQAQVEGGWEEG